MLRVLVACEYSGVVRDAFRARGHFAMSCDILPTERPGPHYCGDVSRILGAGWDLMIAHPPCTYLNVAGMHWTRRGLRDPKLTDEALAFVGLLLNAPIPRIALENPIGILSTRIRKPEQIVQPYQFGHDASKATCLWLKNLPPLRVSPAWRVPGRVVMVNGKPRERWANQTDSGQNRLGPSETRGKERSKTYSGIAVAMAYQWSQVVKQGYTNETTQTASDW